MQMVLQSNLISSTMKNDNLKINILYSRNITVCIFSSFHNIHEISTKEYLPVVYLIFLVKNFNWMTAVRHMTNTCDHRRQGLKILINLKHCIFISSAKSINLKMWKSYSTMTEIYFDWNMNHHWGFLVEKNICF